MVRVMISSIMLAHFTKVTGIVYRNTATSPTNDEGINNQYFSLW